MVAMATHEATRGKATKESNMALRRYIIERDIPKVGSLEREQLRGAAGR